MGELSGQLMGFKTADSSSHNLVKIFLLELRIRGKPIHRE